MSEKLELQANNFNRAIKNLENEINLLDEQIKDLTSKKKYLELQVRTNRLNFVRKMQEVGIEKIQTAFSYISVRKNELLKILDKSLIPAKYKIIKQEEVIDKIALKKDLKEQEIEGVEIVTNYHLHIKERDNEDNQTKM